MAHLVHPMPARQPRAHGTHRDLGSKCVDLLNEFMCDAIEMEEINQSPGLVQVYQTRRVGASSQVKVSLNVNAEMHTSHVF